MAKRLYECAVCGRKFPEGQGIVISRGGIVLHFHSSRCAAKFLRSLIENGDECILRSVRDVLDNYKQAIEIKRKAMAKRI